MDAHEFDALVSQITSQASRRKAVLGLAGGALTSAGIVMAAEASKKKRGTGRKADRRAKVSAQSKGGKKRKICLCASYELLECEDKKVKKSKVRKLLRDNPGSHSGECEPLSNRLPGRDK